MASINVTRPKLVVILRACGSGKSVLLKHLVKTMFESGNLSWCRVYSKTHRANHEYGWLPDGAVHDIDLEEIHEYQEKLLSAREKHGGDKLSMHALIIDDSQRTIRNTYDKRLLA
jgi:hypothetical protein